MMSTRRNRAGSCNSWRKPGQEFGPAVILEASQNGHYPGSTTKHVQCLVVAKQNKVKGAQKIECEPRALS